ncbi:unnamed protein product, partial [Coregonus sp. 'balchen']
MALTAEPIKSIDRGSRKRRGLESMAELLHSNVFPRIPNPIACLSSNDMLILQRTINYTVQLYQTGKYVFLDNAVPEWSLVAVVSERGTECDPTAAVFQPMNPAQLVMHGVIKQHRLNLLPDWGAIVGKLVCQGKLRPKWHSLGEAIPPSLNGQGVLGCRGVGEGAEAEEPAVCHGG